MNLILTDVCNRACPYCFAQSKVALDGRGEKGVATPITLENYLTYLDFLKRSGIRELKLLGGEPTTHPKFELLIEVGLTQGFSITVFTNGLWSTRVQQLFKSPDTSEVQFLVNVNEPAFQGEWETEKQRVSLKVAGQRAGLGFNIYRQGFDLLFVADHINEFGLKREVRLGLAHPIVGETNSAARDDELPLIGTQLISQLRQLEARDILGRFDCGFPLCMFSEDDLGALITCSTGFSAHCGIIVDVGPDLTMWPCFPLSKLHNVSLHEFENKAAVDAYFFDQLSGLSAIGSLPRCIGCKYKQRMQCSGGCVARTLRSWSTTGDTDVVEKLSRRMVTR